jgi:uncharacterized protein YkwD
MRNLSFRAAPILVCLTFLSAGPISQAESLVPTQSSENQGLSIEPKTIMLWRGEKWMLDYTNWVRQRFGAEPLIVDPSLQESCRRHCAWMSRNNSMVHSSGPAENIAMGQADVSQAMTSWEHSSGHFANMVNRSHRVCGMACYQMPNGQRFYCQQFAH